MSTTSARPMLGLRRQPGRIALTFMRMPLRAYRHNAGWMLGETFVKFTHTGRRTGTAHDAVAMVVHLDPDTREVVFCAGWPHTDWYRNLQAAPATSAQVGRDSFTPDQRFLTDEEAFDIVRAFRRDHPRRVKLISAILGWGSLDTDTSLRNFVGTHPFVALRPTQAGPRAPQLAEVKERPEEVAS